jgi:lysophospholipase L1-like esterase
VGNFRRSMTRKMRAGLYLVVLAVGGGALLMLSTRSRVDAGECPAVLHQEPALSRSLVQLGNLAPLQAAFAKARLGEIVTVSAIGGSITAGARASAPKNGYVWRVGDWWRARFPMAQWRFVNAGIGSTGSIFGALRAERDLLSRQPDVVIIDFAVNDADNTSFREALEGLVRRILSLPNRPAVILLFMSDQTGKTNQGWQQEIGHHYGLPMVSYGNALSAEIDAGHVKWQDIGADFSHPNDCGHGAIASYIIHLFELAEPTVSPYLQLATTSLPPPLYSDMFQFTRFERAADLKPVSIHGWAFDENTSSWISKDRDAAIEFEITGAVLVMSYWARPGAGQVRVIVDGKSEDVVSGNSTWVSTDMTKLIARFPDVAKHRVRIEALPSASSGAEGVEFRLRGLGAAGLQPE